MDDHDLAIDDGFAMDGQRTGNLGEALGPIQPSAGEDLLPSAVEVDLNAIAVVLDLVKPLVALGAVDFNVASWGLMNPGISMRFDTQKLTKARRLVEPAPRWRTSNRIDLCFVAVRK